MLTFGNDIKIGGMVISLKKYFYKLTSNYKVQYHWGEDLVAVKTEFHIWKRGAII